MANRKHLGFRIVREAEVKRVLDRTLQRAFESIEQSYVSYSSGETTTLPTTFMRIGDQGMFFSFPAHLHGHPYFIAKVATFYPQNRVKGSPSIQPRILVWDATDGSLVAMIEARYLAGVRTALTSAVGVKHLLAKPPHTLAILGSGVQAESHARVLTHLFRAIAEIRVYSPAPANRSRFVQTLKHAIPHVHTIESETPNDAVTRADLIACVSNSKLPLFESAAVQESACILGVGSMGKEMQEIPDETMVRAQVIVDSAAQSRDYGEIAGPLSRGRSVEVFGEIGEIVARTKTVPQGSKLIVFKHHGLPVTDAALAEIVLG